MKGEYFAKGLIDKGAMKQPLYIVIHNAASPATAGNVALYNYNQTIVKKANTGFAHFYVDDNSVIQLVKDTNIAWHSGKTDMNKKSIGIEICVNPYECFSACKHKDCITNKTESLCESQKAMIQRFFKAEELTIDLTRQLMSKWNIDENHVIFHSDVKATGCPYFTKKLHNITTGREFLHLFDGR